MAYFLYKRTKIFKLVKFHLAVSRFYVVFNRRIIFANEGRNRLTKKLLEQTTGDVIGVDVIYLVNLESISRQI